VTQKRYVLSGYAAWVALLIAIYYWVDGLRVTAWGLISLSGIAAMVAGLILNRPARKAPWILLAAALTCFAAGQLSFLIAADLKVALPFPSFADVLYLSCYPLYAIGLLIFIYWRSPGGDLRSLIDALTLTAGLGLLSWTFLIQPYVNNPALTGLQKTVAVAYPLGDVLMLALLTGIGVGIMPALQTSRVDLRPDLSDGAGKFELTNVPDGYYRLDVAPPAGSPYAPATSGTVAFKNNSESTALVWLQLK